MCSEVLGFETDPDFTWPGALADAVKRYLDEGSPPPSACILDPSVLALLVSGASDHIVGRSSLTGRERHRIYKVELHIYTMAEGTVTMTKQYHFGWFPFQFSSISIAIFF